MKPYTLDDAETELRHVLDTCTCMGCRGECPGSAEACTCPCTCGAMATATALATHVDRLQPDEATPTLGGSALWYAEHGHPVFPITPGHKKPPLTRHGLHDATTEADQVRSWWTTWPTANIGVATGHRFDVVDIDGPAGQKTRARLWDRAFAQIGETAYATVTTPRPGGMHLYVPAGGSGNFAHKLDGVDYRGNGGYVLAPPSTILPNPINYPDETPGLYRFIGTPSLADPGK